MTDRYSLNSNYVFGYYPTSRDGCGYGSKDLMSSKGSVRVSTRNDFNSHYGPKGYTEYTLSITSGQLSSLQSYLSNNTSNPGNYNLFLMNCISVIISGLENAGVPLRIPLGDSISPSLTSPAVFGSELSHPVYIPGLVTGMQHYGGN